MQKIILYIFCISYLHASAQQEPVKISPYIFEKFMQGTVTVKSGITSQQNLNYNLLTGEMVYEHNGQYLAIANPEDVDTVLIGERRFVPVGMRFYEWLLGQEEPLFAEPTCSIQEPGVETGFGSTTTTAASSIKSLIRSGEAYQLKLPDNFKLVKGNNFWIKKKYQYHKINTVSKLIKLYPEKSRSISGWVKTHNTNFSKQEDVVALVKAIQ